MQFLLEGLVTTFAGGAIGIAMSYLLVWAISPRPFLAELLDDASRVTDIHLVLSPQLVGICTSILMLVGSDRRPAAGDQGVAARSDRSAALRVKRRAPLSATRARTPAGGSDRRRAGSP